MDTPGEAKLSPEITNVRQGPLRLGTESDARTLRRELEEEIALRRSLLDVGTRLGAASADASLDTFELLADRVASVVPIRTLTIYVKEAADDHLRPVYHSQDDAAGLEAAMAVRVPVGAGPTGRAAGLRQSVVANAGAPGAPTGPPDAHDHVLAVPVLIEEQVKAVFTLRRPGSERPFTRRDAHRAELFAQHVATVFLLTELAESRRLLSNQVEALKDLNRLKDEFVANVSHELRTPLTAILGNVMTVAGLGEMLGANERRELLRAAERQAKRLAELLENLLAESRLAGADPGLAPAQVDLRPFLEEVADTLRFRAPDRVVETRSAGRVEILTDRTLLYRILFNLGDNALKYSDDAVLIEARACEGGVQIDVVDRGPGIAPADVVRIFEQFEQLDGSSSRRVGGVGLGLHLCATAAATLGGRLWVESAPETGSRFSVWLPSQPPA